MKKLKKGQIKEAEIYITDKDDIKTVKPELEKDDKLIVTGSKKGITENDDMSKVVEYSGEINGEPIFKLGGESWKYVWATYPDGKRDVGVLKVNSDIVYDYDWFKNNHLQSKKIEEETDTTGVEGRDLNKLKNDVINLMDKLKSVPIMQTAIKKINTPIEQYEIISQFAELIGVPRARLMTLISSIKDTAKLDTNESVNPKIKKGEIIETLIKHGVISENHSINNIDNFIEGQDYPELGGKLINLDQLKVVGEFEGGEKIEFTRVKPNGHWFLRPIKRGNKAIGF